MAFILAIVLACVGLASFIYVPLLESQRHPDATTSAKNLGEIGDMLRQYASDNHGRYPDNFSTLYLNENIGADAFIYPGRDQTVATGTSRQQIAAELADPQHCSYVYLAARMKPPVDPQRAVVMERPEEDQETVQVLVAGGIVEPVSREEAMKIMNDPMELAQTTKP